MVGGRPRPWQRLGVRVAAGFLAVTVLGIALAGGLIYRSERAALEETLGNLLLNVARTGALRIDPDLHVEVQRTGTQGSEAYRRLRRALAEIQDVNEIATPIYTLTDYESAARQARFMVTSRGPGLPGEPYPLVSVLIEPLERAFRDGVPSKTGIYRNQSGTWITAFAPIKGRDGRTIAVLDVDYNVDVFLKGRARIWRQLLGASLAGGLVALAVGVFLARRVTGPVSALTRGVARVAAGDLSQALSVRSRDEVGQLTSAFNEMLEGLRQRDFIRDTFGRYVSHEVAQTLLDSPEGLRLGGEKREVTVLMSDLRGYTRFVEDGDPAMVVRVLNHYLGRMTEIVIEHGGTINEFVGDGIVAFFGAPLATPDHAERAAACAIAMQVALTEINAQHAAEDLPRLLMGIGLNTGEAIVGNVGSEKRAKYTVIGTAINLAARVEACTVGGQVLLSPHTYARVRDLAEVSAPIPVEVKGLKDPLLLYELRALGGRFARRLPDADGSGVEAPVDLPLTCWVVEGKAVRPDGLEGRATRLMSRRLAVRFEGPQVPLAPLTNLRLRLRFPALDQESEDVYGKVVTVSAADGGWLAWIALTSVHATDQQILETLAGVSPRPRPPG